MATHFLRLPAAWRICLSIVSNEGLQEHDQDSERERGIRIAEHWLLIAIAGYRGNNFRM